MSQFELAWGLKRKSLKRRITRNLETSSRRIRSFTFPQNYPEKLIRTQECDIVSNANLDLSTDDDINPSLSPNTSFQISDSENETDDTVLHQDMPNDNSTLNIDLLHLDSSVLLNSSLSQQLQNWVTKCNITHTALRKLLSLLRPFISEHLPRDPRTLLNTPKSTKIITMGSGIYTHIGVAYSVKQQLKTVPNKYIPEIIYLDYNVDGLPISKSTNSNVWPIQGLIRNLDQFKLPPFVVGIYHGYDKPKDSNEYLKSLYDELLFLQNNTVKIEELEVIIRVRSFICDTPAKTFITGTKGHTGYFGCSKCVQEGTHIDRRMCFTESNAELRTDDGFSLRKQTEHHLFDPILEKIGMGMVSQFPLDYLHLVCLGVMKKLLTLWSEGPLECRLSNSMIEKINERLASAEFSRPAEFSRNIRGLETFKRWKATELRTFLLYTGPVVLKNILSNKVYNHFLLFHSAIRILEHETFHKKFIELARDLLLNFVEKFKIMYGDSHLVYNVHNLVHLCNDVELYGKLHNFSAFPFENNMQQVKRMIRKKNKPLQQISNRLFEKSISEVNTIGVVAYPIFKKSNLIQFKNFKINCTDKNKWFLTNTNDIIMFKETKMVNGKYFISGQKLKKQDSFYKNPFNSVNLQIFSSDGILEEKSLFEVKEVSSKLFSFRLKNAANVIFIPLL